MNLERLGSLSPSRLSFARTLLRHMREERWSVERVEFHLDADGHGETIYRITTPSSHYHVVIFAQALDDELRSDRVIAEAWDVTFCLIEGDVTDELRRSMALNVPLQEAGRQHPKLLVISRANKSVRNFDHFIDALSSGIQPDVNYLKRAGYIYRTTASTVTVNSVLLITVALNPILTLVDRFLRKWRRSMSCGSFQLIKQSILLIKGLLTLQLISINR